MAIRETLNRNALQGSIIASAVVGIALVAIVWQLWPGRLKDVYAKAYFTADDGASYYVDDSSHLPPYEKDGKEAHYAQVVRCGGGKAFVSFLMRYDEGTRKKLAEAQAEGRLGAALATARMEYKQVGGGQWVKSSDARVSEITRVTCPEGKGEAEVVLPPN